MQRDKDIKKGFAVLVVSCDRYSDLWAPFFALFKRFWPDCPFKVYLLSNDMRAEFDGVENILSGQDISWSDNLIKAIDAINEEYVLLFIDDLFLCAPVDTNGVLQVFGWINSHKPNCVRMNCYADSLPVENKPDKPFNSLVGMVSPGMNYRVSTVLTVWKTGFLRSMLLCAENAWEFEINGTRRSDRFDGFFSTWRNYFPVVNCVIRGKWRKGALRKISALGVSIPADKRAVMSHTEELALYLKERRSYVLSLIPRRYRVRIKGLLSAKGVF